MFDPNRVKLLREQLVNANLKASQNLFADFIEKERSGYSKKESGKADFTAKEIGKLIAGLKTYCDPDLIKTILLYFFGLSDSPDLDKLFQKSDREFPDTIGESLLPYKPEMDGLLAKAREVLESSTPWADNMRMNIISTYSIFKSEQSTGKKSG